MQAPEFEVEGATIGNFDCPRQHIAAASARLDHLITGGKVKVAAKLLFRVLLTQ